jgi:hypothetical protein
MIDSIFVRPRLENRLERKIERLKLCEYIYLLRGVMMSPREDRRQLLASSGQVSALLADRGREKQDEGPTVPEVRMGSILLW